MKKSELTKEESELYIKIVKVGSMDDMFNFGYIMGGIKFAEDELKNLKNKTKK